MQTSTKVSRQLECDLQGPFEVTEVILRFIDSNPKYMKSTHNAFHVSRLRPFYQQMHSRLGS
jgi:hypothetical protein